MKLDFGKYMLGADSHNWTIYHKRIVQEGENKGNEYELPEAYFPTLSSALNGLLDRQLSETDVQSVMDLLHEIRVARDQIIATVKQAVEDERPVMLRV